MTLPTFFAVFSFPWACTFTSICMTFTSAYTIVQAWVGVTWPFSNWNKNRLTCKLSNVRRIFERFSSWGKSWWWHYKISTTNMAYLLFSQWSPANPLRHSHLNVEPWPSQWPPFWHGLGLHGPSPTKLINVIYIFCSLIGNVDDTKLHAISC